MLAFFFTDVRPHPITVATAPTAGSSPWLGRAMGCTEFPKEKGGDTLMMKINITSKHSGTIIIGLHFVPPKLRYHCSTSRMRCNLHA